MNNWYNNVAGNMQPRTPQPQMNFMQALMNPVAFVRQVCPDVPENIINDPDQVLSYLMNTRGISQNYIQQLINMMPRR